MKCLLRLKLFDIPTYTYYRYFTVAASSGETGTGSGQTAPAEFVVNNSKTPLHRRQRQNRPIVQEQRKRNQELETKAAAEGLGWKISCSTILHRYPVILKMPEKWELDMEYIDDKIEAIKREQLVSELEGTPGDIMTTYNPTYEDILKSMPFQPASRITEADISNNRRSNDRKLDSSLFLIVKRNRQDHAWQFPQGKILPDETFRAAGERIIDRAVGKLDRWFLSNGTVGHYCYEYPKEIKEQRKLFGAKIFFTRCQLLSGNIKLETRLYKDYAWIGRDEIIEYFPQDMLKFMEALLPY